MELILIRKYYPKGTNGILQMNGTTICRMIELPMKNNIPLMSCIPEGKYRLQIRFSQRHDYHLWVQGVPGRNMILIHPANDAMRQLKGCLAPVIRITGEGRGIESWLAFDKLMKLVRVYVDREEDVWLRITNGAAVLQPGIWAPIWNIGNKLQLQRA